MTAAERQARAGFTLVELMVTVAILGLLASAVLLSLPPPEPAAARDARRFAADLRAMAQVSIVRGETTGIWLRPDGWQAVRATATGWTPLTGQGVAGRFDPRTRVLLPEPARRAADRAVPAIRFDPVGLSTPFAVTFAGTDSTGDDSRTVVRLDGAGKVLLEGADAPAR